MGQPSFETLEVYQIADRLGNEVWRIVVRWSLFARDTVGKQLVRAADSIAANIAEGYGRGSYADNKRFIHIARGSLNETISWLTRAAERNLLTPAESASLKRLTDELGPRLGGYLSYINRQIAGQATRGEPPPKG